jgi:hypothetical protein
MHECLPFLHLYPFHPRKFVVQDLRCVIILLFQTSVCSDFGFRFHSDSQSIMVMNLVDMYSPTICYVNQALCQLLGFPSVVLPASLLHSTPVFTRQPIQASMIGLPLMKFMVDSEDCNTGVENKYTYAPPPPVKTNTMD